MRKQDLYRGSGLKPGVNFFTRPHEEPSPASYEQTRAAFGHIRIIRERMREGYPFHTTPTNGTLEETLDDSTFRARLPEHKQPRVLDCRNGLLLDWVGFSFMRKLRHTFAVPSEHTITDISFFRESAVPDHPMPDSEIAVRGIVQVVDNPVSREQLAQLASIMGGTTEAASSE